MSVIRIAVDPTGAWADQGADPERLEAACGALQHWARATPTEATFKDWMTACYQFPISEADGGTMDDDGTFHYPDDPPQYPLMKATRNDSKEIMYVYQYSIVMFIDDNGTQFRTRMN